MGGKKKVEPKILEEDEYQLSTDGCTDLKNVNLKI